MRVSTRRWAGFAAALALVALAAPFGASAQARDLGSPTATPAVPASTHPAYSLRRELAVVGLGSGLALGAIFVSTDVRAVPTQGLDPAGISWSLDRRSLGRVSADADALSDWARNAALAYPFLLAWAANPGSRWDAVVRRGLVYGEAFLIAGGLGYLGKHWISRARPYTYLTSGERAADPTLDATENRAFESLPSGHATSAFVGAGLGITDHLLTRPRASGLERFAVGALGGALGGATAALRVEAGRHFPTDVLAGAGIGLATGVTLPLLHRGARPWPTRRAWLEATAGLAFGALVSAAAVFAAY
jgi:membrane-associated phospholipid phosphatase